MSVHRLKSVLAVYGPGLGRTVAKARGPSAEFETYFVVSGKHTLWLWNVETVLSRWIERGRYPRTSHDTHSRQNGTISENCARRFLYFCTGFCFVTGRRFVFRLLVLKWLFVNSVARFLKFGGALSSAVSYRFAYVHRSRFHPRRTRSQKAITTCLNWGLRCFEVAGGHARSRRLSCFKFLNTVYLHNARICRQTLPTRQISVFYVGLIL